MDRELLTPRAWIICVLLAVCTAVPIIKSEQLESVAVNGVNLRKGVQTTGISGERTRSANFDEEYKIDTLSDKQERNNGQAGDSYGRKSGLTDCQFDKIFTACVKLSFLHKIAEVLRFIKEVDIHNHSVELSGGVESSRRNVVSELDTYDKWRDGDITEGHKLQLLMVSGISSLLQNRSLSFTFIPGFTVNIISIIRPNVANLYVRLIQSGEKNKNNFDQTDGRSMMKMKPWMLVPGALMVGMFPYTLLQLKMFVTSAMTFSNMVLWGAVFMTLRNFLFGNRPNGIIVYDNLGYTTEPPLPHNPGVRQPSPHGPASDVTTRLPFAPWTPKFRPYYPSEASLGVRHHHIAT